MARKSLKTNKGIDTESIAGVLFVFIFLILTFTIIFGYQVPTLQKQSKQMVCLDNGYFDYDEVTDTCWDLGHINVDSFECVEEGKCKGRHK